MIGIVTQQPREIDFLAKILFYFIFFLLLGQNFEQCRERIHCFCARSMVSHCWRVRFSIPSLVCNIE